jgi:nitrate reductase gamma subunit
MTSDILVLILLVIICIVGMRKAAAKAQDHQREVLCKGEDEGLMPTYKRWSAFLT